jgi:DNA-binding NarL/FixJ family response regulator
VPDQPRVLIIADDPLTRTGLAALLADQADCTVAGQMAGSGDLVAGVAAYLPDVIVWDLGWEPSAALERLADLKDEAIPIVALIADEAHANDAWIAGARGLLLRSASSDNLAAALIAVARGLVVLDPALGTAMLAARSRLDAPPVEELTARERQVLQALAEGLANKAIALRLGISEHTVKFHVGSLLDKLGAASRTEAVTLATRRGILAI